jgi:hypothetical protein
MQSLLPLLCVVLISLGICAIAWLVMLPIQWHAERRLREAKADLAAAQRELMEARANLIIEEAAGDLLESLQRGDDD